MSIADKVFVLGERLFLVLSKLTVNASESENAPINCWKVLVYQVNDKKWSNFTVEKNEMIECTCKHINKLKAMNIPVWYICFNPAGKIKTGKASREKRLGNTVASWFQVYIQRHSTT